MPHIGGSLVIDVIETASLGDHSYLVSDGAVAVVIDPQRDTGRITTLLSDRGVRLTHVLETHLHNDYVSGGLSLSRATGAEYVLPEEAVVAFARRPVSDGDVIESGDLRLRAVHTPGHTPHHASYVLERKGHAVAAFTGGSMLHGSAGRTDLMGPRSTEALTRAQHASVRRLARDLPSDVEVHPTHGFGSFCAATATGNSSTIGQQRRLNPAVLLPEQVYVETFIAGLTPFPDYYEHMPAINAAGAPPWVPSPVVAITGGELIARIDAGDWVVDLRPRRQFARLHAVGTVNVELSPNLATYVGWLLPWGAPITMVAETMGQVDEACLELGRIGIDGLAGAWVGDLADLTDLAGLAPAGRTRSYSVAGFHEVIHPRTERPTVVLDVRRADERQLGSLPGSLHVPVHEIGARVAELPPGQVWVHCASGYRAAIVASWLERAGRDVVLVDDDFGDAVGAPDPHARSVRDV